MFIELSNDFIWIHRDFLKRSWYIQDFWCLKNCENLVIGGDRWFILMIMISPFFWRSGIWIICWCGGLIGRDGLPFELKAELQGKRLVPEAERSGLVKERHTLWHMERRRMCLSLFHDDFYWPKMIKLCLWLTSSWLGWVLAFKCCAFYGFHPSKVVDPVLLNELWLMHLSVSMKKSSSGAIVMLVVLDAFPGYTWLRALRSKEK